MPKWRVPHKITDKSAHSYKLDNGKYYKYYELHAVTEAQKIDKNKVQPTITQLQKMQSAKLDFKRSGLDLRDFVEVPRALKQVERLNL